MALSNAVQILENGSIDFISLSEFMWKPADFMVQRRLAPPIHTLNFYKDLLEQLAIDGAARINQVIIESGFIVIDSFSTGATLTERNQVLRLPLDGRLYRWLGNLPKVVPANSTPSSTGGFSANAWLEVSDIALRQEINAAGGIGKIANAASYFNNLAAFNAEESAIKENSSVFLYSINQGLDLDGEGRVYTYSKTTKNGFIEIKTPLGYLSRVFDGKVYIAEHGAIGDDFDKDSAALQKCFDNIRSAVAGGIISMGTRCKYKIKGELYANCSNLDWQFNKSTVTLGSTWIAWHPNKLGYANHNNLKITDAIWLGDSAPEVSTHGNIHMDLCKVDNVRVTGCTYIEALWSGHFLDLMGSRHVYFENNTVNGSCITTRSYAEALQVGICNTAGAGMTLTPGSSAFFDELPTTDVYMRNNTFEPYTNPVTGIRSYPPRPIGDHSSNGLHKNIIVEHNKFNNIQKLSSETTDPLRTIINLAGYHNIVVDNNEFICDEYDARSSSFVSITVLPDPNNSPTSPMPYFSASNNDIKLYIESTGTFGLAGYGIKFEILNYNSAPSKGRIIKARDNNIDMTIPLGSGGGYGISITNNSTYAPIGNDFDINDNKFSLNGGFTSAIRVDGADRAGVENYKRNKFKGLLNSFALFSGISTNTDKNIWGNTYTKQWRAVYTGLGRIVMLDEVLDGFSLKAFDGSTTKSDSSGGSSTITVYPSSSVVSVFKRNMLLGEARANPVKITNTTVRPVDEFLITTT